MKLLTNFQLISQKAICPKYDDILAKMYSDPPDELRSFVSDNTELFEYISKYTGAVNCGEDVTI